MKTISTITIFLLLQSASPLATKLRHFLQKRLIAHF
jgi:hypothetical protein